MALREFADAGGHRWMVWEVRPRHVASITQPAGAGPQVRASHRDGWLAFECPSLQGKRRYMPVPDGWAEMSDEQLARLCDLAHGVRQTRRLL